MLGRASSFLRIALCALAVGSLADSCYFPDGRVASGYVACSSNGGGCCDAKDICLSSGLCMGIIQPFSLYRGACTDSNWGSSCPTTCATAQLASSCTIVTKINTPATGKQYCCNNINSNGDCGIGTQFTLDNATVVVGRAALANLVSSSSSTTTSQTTSTAGTATTGTTAKAGTTTGTSTGTSAGTATGTETCAAVEATAVNSSCSSIQQASTKSHDVAIGVGVGVPLAFIAATAVLWALWERKRWKPGPSESVGAAHLHAAQFPPGASDNVSATHLNAAAHFPQGAVPPITHLGLAPGHYHGTQTAYSPYPDAHQKETMNSKSPTTASSNTYHRNPPVYQLPGPNESAVAELGN